jgi:NADH dehydrogenase FAD-containing subunit
VFSRNRKINFKYLIVLIILIKKSIQQELDCFFKSIENSDFNIRHVTKRRAYPIDKGSLATIGRRRAVADLPKNIKFQGVFAWYVWLVVHLFFLVGFRNKVSVLTDWIWNYITWDRRVRLIIKPFKGNQNH